MADIPIIYKEAIVILGAAIVAAPLFKRIGLGTVLGYLAAGVLVGPILKLISDAEDILHFSELGVVLLLFIIGLELNPRRLWSMRSDIFGLGLTQVVLSGVLLTALALLVLPGWQKAVVVGMGLALSSTAFALQLMEASGQRNTPHGRKTFSILLFQDLAIIPILAILPLFAFGEDVEMDLSSFAIAVGAVAFLILAGRYVLNHVFTVIAGTGAKEAMIAAALFVVFGSALLMQMVGLSMALGSFLAGVLLAESTYRHELEADIEPFRGLLLGLFFIAIGMSIDPAIIAEHFLTILICVPLAMLAKAVTIYAAARMFGNDHETSVRVAAILPQHGEFGFVIFAAASALGILTSSETSQLISIVVLTMALTPLTIQLGEKLVTRKDDESMEEDFEGAGSPVLMVGFSRMGQVASQALLASGTEVTIIDNNPERIRNASKFGFRIYYGDGTRLDVLEAAGIEEAKIVAVCTHKPEITNRIIDLIKAEYPEKRIYARTYDRAHTLELMEKDIVFHIRETFESALVFGGKMLEGLGLTQQEAHEIVKEVRKLDTERLMIQKSEGIYSGMDKLHTKALKPEPLVAPKHDGEALDESSKEFIAEEAADDTDDKKVAS